jgi:DNA-binding transcriptional MerR regulator
MDGVPVDASKLINTPEAGRLLGVSRHTITRLVRQGRLQPVQKLPGDTGAYLFDPADILARLQAQANQLEAADGEAS